MDDQNYSEAQANDGQSNESNNSAGGNEIQHNDDSSLILDVTIDVPFNNRNQAIGKEGRKLSSFLGIIARTPELTPLYVDNWRNFDKEEKKKLVDFVRKKFSIPKRGEVWILKSLAKKWKAYKCDLKAEYAQKYKTKDALLKNRPSRIPRDQWSGLVSYWLSDKAKRRTQGNRNNRAKQTRPHTGGSKSIATLMNEQAVNGIEPTRVEIFLLTHKKRKDGRLLDDDSVKTIFPDANSGHERVPQTSRMPSVAENAQSSHVTTHFCPSSLLFFQFSCAIHACSLDIPSYSQ
uniref:Uncharacterized protein LOC104213017 n=1 Tax=Nicotiana sylvestris TaxID=4096 RepID=A0A1U7VEF6_NICSY|nr:PREDICTED: uncharacterized protein LOC104213017 [Nicotiana sylvestris]